MASEACVLNSLVTFQVLSRPTSARYPSARARLRDNGPTLGIFNYDLFESRGTTAVNRPGFGHIAFAVDDVAAAQNEPPQPRLACPKCGANQTLPIEYGLPNFDLLPLPEERDFVLGGCCIGSDLPKWFRKERKYRWGKLFNRMTAQTWMSHPEFYREVIACLERV